MLRRICLLGLLLCNALRIAAQPGEPLLLEINSASRAELESLPGLGPALVERILLARAQAPFKDWGDLRRRVRGIGATSAGKLSALGLRVSGQAYPP